eukprot:scaffold413_cov176-Ochromonas_danica.AAC.26
MVPLTMHRILVDKKEEVKVSTVPLTGRNEWALESVVVINTSKRKTVYFVAVSKDVNLTGKKRMMR